MAAAFPAAVLLAPAPALAAPEPSPIPTRWQLDIDPGPLRVASVDVPGSGPQAFFYMTYTVTNNSGEDLYFAPSFELAMEKGRVLRSGRGVPTAVTQELLRRLNNPFLLDQISIIGTLRQGEEHAREGLIIWPAETLKPSRLVVYCMGFSGETRRVARPDAPAAAASEEAEVVLRKTLMLEHAVSGELSPRGGAPVERTGQRWILR